ncbi:TetR/AcrR family transcriptional regulator [Chryseobacterium sp. SIMBA_038]|uniref:TetR/AcrR family transcriptional regulator n=1 Tax=Chryseobacterium sp. SIMBA_038 TaxID=3085780 RepID=UPI00397976EF
MGRNKNFIEEEILDKAIVVFQERGFTATSPEELVKHLGLSRSSLYSTFGDKRALLIRSLNRYHELTGEALNKIKIDNIDPTQGIEQVFELAIQGCYHPGKPNGCFLVNSIIEFSPEDNGPLEIVQESYRECRDALVHFIEIRKNTSLSFKNIDVEITADYLINAISGMVVSAKAGMDEKACRLMVKKTLSNLL